MDKRELIDSLEGRIMGGELHQGGYIHVPQDEAKQILALLKEQEAMPIKDDKHWTQFKCPRCNAQLQRTTFFKMDTRFCKYCGQEVKFE